MDEETQVPPTEPEIATTTPETKTDVPEQRRRLVEEWCEKITAAEKHYEETFKQMRTSQDFAMYGADKDWIDSNKYTVPILPRYINQSVSTLYARNPKTTYKRKQRLLYQMWDGRSDSLQAAMQMARLGDGASMALIQEVLSVRQQNMLLDRMGETLNILWQYYLDEQSANFKQQLKLALRRAKVCKVAYVKLGYQRALEPRPEITARIDDVTSKVAEVEKTLAEIAEGELYDEQSAKLEELRLNLQDLERDEMLVVREGPVFDFPKSDHIIVDPKCVHLKSLSGAEWIAHKFEMTPDDIEKVFQVDVGQQYTQFAPDGNPYSKDCEKQARAHVYEVQDKKNQQVFFICKGYKDFLREPATPEIWTERFWSIFPIVFNETEHYKEIYPRSDVEQAADIQREYNRSREELKQHRIAARPFYVTGAQLDETEKSKLSVHASHEIVTLPTLGPDADVSKLVQRGPVAPIDPNLYETEQHFGDLMRVIGYQEAQIGATSGSTATESSIAQQSQSVSQSDNVDDFDEMLTELARAGGQVLLMNVTKETVIEIVGEGAVWPDTPESREQAAKEIMLEVEAGSTGRPNQAAELANMERGMPFIQNLPGINPMPIGKRYLELLNIDVEDAFAENLPSITALNAIITKMATGNPAASGAAPTGDPATDPASQGQQGANNAPAAAQTQPGPQPAYSAQA